MSLFHLSNEGHFLASMPSELDWQLILFAIGAFLIIGVGLAGMILFTKAKFGSKGTCKIAINDDPSLTKEADTGNTLLAALTSNGLPIPSPCGGKATCKQCRVQITKGSDEPLETDKSTFTKKQLKAGWRLSCQAKVKGDLSVHVEESCLGVKEWVGRVISNKNVSSYIKELVVEVPEEVPYRSGGYLQVHVPPFKTNTGDWRATMDPEYFTEWEKYQLFDRIIDFSQSKGVIRAYSMASYPAEGKKVMFNIRIATPPFANNQLVDNVPWGVCSSYTFSLKPGDEIRLSGPYGESFMINDDRELIFLIGGAGSSFARSHILHLFKTENTKRKVSLWYGARSLKENIYQEEYEALAQEFPNFSYHLVLSEPLPEDQWPTKAEDPVRNNYLFRAFEEGKLKFMESPEDALFYVCGPPLHNSSVLKLLDNYGVPRNSVILDDFGS
ncbi:MAG: nqrF [Chlamydiales bacterium]|jgi:Na+-transporting NADH:ubiquinone oxidoreductase subunit F|nr:nqrF [Chlamydiales bacterium]